MIEKGMIFENEHLLAPSDHIYIATTTPFATEYRFKNQVIAIVKGDSIEIVEENTVKRIARLVEVLEKAKHLLLTIEPVLSDAGMGSHIIRNGDTMREIEDVLGEKDGK